MRSPFPGAPVGLFVGLPGIRQPVPARAGPCRPRGMAWFWAVVDFVFVTGPPLAVLPRGKHPGKVTGRHLGIRAPRAFVMPMAAASPGLGAARLLALDAPVGRCARGPVRRGRRMIPALVLCPWAKPARKLLAPAAVAVCLTPVLLAPAQVPAGQAAGQVAGQVAGCAVRVGPPCLPWAPSRIDADPAPQADPRA